MNHEAVAIVNDLTEMRNKHENGKNSNFSKKLINILSRIEDGVYYKQTLIIFTSLSLALVGISFYQLYSKVSLVYLLLNLGLIIGLNGIQFGLAKLNTISVTKYFKSDGGLFTASIKSKIDKSNTKKNNKENIYVNALVEKFTSGNLDLMKMENKSLAMEIILKSDTYINNLDVIKKIIKVTSGNNCKQLMSIHNLFNEYLKLLESDSLTEDKKLIIYLEISSYSENLQDLYLLTRLLTKEERLIKYYANNFPLESVQLLLSIEKTILDNRNK